MKAYDLKPTWDNLMRTFSEDTIGRNSDISHFVRMLNAVEDSCAIALEGNWGCGKTFFVKQVKFVLDAYNAHTQAMENADRKQIQTTFSKYYKEDAEPCPQVCVYYDAWENDNDDDPILSLVYMILQSVQSDFSFKNSFCIETAASILDFFTGKNWEQLVRAFKGEDPLSPLRQSKNIEQLVQKFLDSLLSERGNRLVIFIDELDRCKPNYAVRLLERIKHYFSNDRITFVFSVNIAELQHTIKKHYGNDFDSSRYLDRFFDLRVTLPPANIEKFYLSLQFNDFYYTYDIIAGAVIKAYHFELREIARYLRLLKIAASDPAYNRSSSSLFSSEKSLQFAICYIIPIMIGLKICDSQRYKLFIEGKDYKPLIEISDAVHIRYFEELLNQGESYYQNNNEKDTVVSLENKLRNVYDAIFADKIGEEPYVDIGNMRFTKEMKEKLLRIDGLFSHYTHIE
ncbi:MAG: P-loop NTPase fold protein [Candidatus Faecousia sp.]|nr:P-loop NTPase fold protein [Candidatus Faecousia sp.]